MFTVRYETIFIYSSVSWTDFNVGVSLISGSDKQWQTDACA